MSKKSEQVVVGIFFALGDQTRLKLVSRLGREPLSATSLSAGAAVTRQAIMKHLQVLESVGVVSHIKRGREVLYSLEKHRFNDARAFLDEVSAGWDRAIERLRHMVEERPAETRRVAHRP